MFEDIVKQLTALWKEIDRLKSFDVHTGKPWHPWTPTLTGWSANPTNCVYRYALLGKTCFFSIRQATAGTSDAVTAILTLPFTAATITNMLWMFPAGVINSGASAVWGRGVISSGGTTINFGLSVAADAGFTASGDKRITACDGWYEVA